MKRHALALAVAAIGIALAPAPSSAAVKKIPVTVTFTAVDDDGGLVGVVESANAKCVTGKDVYDRYPNPRFSTETNSAGEFTMSTELLSEINFESFDATVAKGDKFGPKKKKKQCQADSAHVETSPPGAVDVQTFEFNDTTNTFSGTLDSDDAECDDAASLTLERYDGSDFFPHATFTSTGTSFSYPFGSQPQSSFWYISAVSFIGESTFGPNGAVSVTYCDPGSFAYTEVP